MATSRPRYSMFGWFLQPGKMYDLYLGEEEKQAQQGQQQVQQPAAGGGRGRLRIGGSGAAGGEAKAGNGKEARRRQGSGEQEQPPAEEAPAEYSCKLAQRIAANAAKRRKGEAAD